MPDKDGDEDKKSTKSVVNKKQKQMMGEEGYDVARDMGRVRPSKDKKDATTMPPSKEMKKTQKVNKGPSALDIVKKKYKGQIMDLSKVAESFGGYIIEAPVDDQGKITAKKGEEEKTKKLISKIKKGREKGVEALSKKIGLKPDPEKLAARNAFIDMKKSGVTPTDDVERGIRSVESGKGPQEPQDQMSPTSGGKRKDASIDAMKSPVLRPTTGGRRITKKMSKSEADEVIKRIDATKPDPKQSARADAKDAERRFKRGFKQSGVSGDFSPTMPTQLRKVRQAQRDARAKELGTPDPFTVDTSTAAADVAKELGTAPVAGGRPFMPRTVIKGVRGQPNVRKKYVEPTGPGGSTLPIQQKREPIPKDTGSLADAPGVKKRFSQLSQDIKDLKRDVKVDKDIESTISRVGAKKGPELPNVDLNKAYRENQKARQQPSNKNASNDPSFKIAGAKGPKSMKDVQLPNFVQNVARPRTRGERIQGAAVNTALKTVIPGLAGAQAGIEVSQGKYTDATLSAVQAMGGPIGFGAGVLRAVRQIRGTDAPRSAKTRRNPPVNVGVNRKTGVRDILQGPNQPPSFDIKGAKGPKNMKDVELPKVPQKERMKQGFDKNKENIKSKRGKSKTSGENLIKQNRVINPEVVTDKQVPDKIKGKITKGGKGGALSIGGALSKAPLRTAGLAALGTQLPKLKGRLKGVPGVKGGKAIRVSAGR